MKISIDCRMVENRVTGTSRHVVNLVRGILNLDDQNNYLLIYRNKEFLTILGEIAEKDNVELLYIDKDVLHSLYIPRINNALNKRSIDLYHFPYFNCPFPINTRKIITIHDISPLIDPEAFQYNKRIKFYYKNMLNINKRRADKIITISDFVRQSIITLLGVSGEEVKTIYHGVEEKFFPRFDNEERNQIEKKYGFKGEYLLYVGNLLPHKNVPQLIYAFAEISKKTKSDLMIVGFHHRFITDLVRLTSELGIANRVKFLTYVEEHDMPLIYAYSKAFISLSRLEGFGLPLLEAMASGIPSVVSDRCSLPEIAGDAALVVDINDLHEVNEAIFTVDNDRAIRESLSRRGLERAKMFSWRKCAQETIDVYKGVLN